jgi:hypothetical protein
MQERDAPGHLADRAEPVDGERPARGDVRVLHGLPGRRQHVGQEQEALVGRALGDLDGAEMGLRHAQVLGLPAGHAAVEVRVAEEARALAVLVAGGRLALREQRLLAVEAVPAGDVERDDDAVAGGDVAHLGPDLLDDAHRLVADDVALLHLDDLAAVEVQVRAADRRRGDADDRVGRLLDRRIGDLVDAHVLLAMPDDGLHLCFSARANRRSRWWLRRMRASSSRTTASHASSIARARRSGRCEIVGMGASPTTGGPTCSDTCYLRWTLEKGAQAAYPPGPCGKLSPFGYGAW